MGIGFYNRRMRAFVTGLAAFVTNLGRTRSGLIALACGSRHNYSQDELTIGSDWKRPATLTTRAGTGPFPALVRAHGSGLGKQHHAA